MSSIQHTVGHHFTRLPWLYFCYLFGHIFLLFLPYGSHHTSIMNSPSEYIGKCNKLILSIILKCEPKDQFSSRCTVSIHEKLGIPWQNFKSYYVFLKFHLLCFQSSCTIRIRTYFLFNTYCCQSCQKGPYFSRDK